MSAPFRFPFHQQTLWLSPEKCIFWEEHKILILSDLHLGKSGHFRKSGVAIPQNIFKKDLQTLFAQVQFFNPETVLITGDLFHSIANKEIDFFLKWRNDMPSLEFILVKGNHDILAKKKYEEAGITVFEDHLFLQPFCFVHDILNHCAEPGKSQFTFSGHIHPGIKLKGPGHQSLMFPCFYFGEKFAVLPSFSAFTGLAKIHPSHTDTIFAIVEKSIIQIQ